VWPFRSAKLNLGQRGEKLAVRTLRAAGCRILARNYRCPAGEADVIALQGDTLVFAEVKTRASGGYADPVTAVDARKRARYRKMARYYLHHTGRSDLPVRFDVVAIIMPEGGKPQIRHIPDAFI